MIRQLRRTAGRTLRRLGWRRGGVELDASWYDRAYARGGNYAEPYASSIHYPVWTVIVDRVRRLGRPSMLDIGCGPGQFADMLADHGIDRYVGFDFSRTAIEIAERRARPGHAFRVADATDPTSYHDVQADVVVCIEVLEHVDRDDLVLRHAPAGAVFIGTVPSFDYPGHVRHFADVEAVLDRYAAWIEDLEILPIAVPDAPDCRWYLMQGRLPATTSA